MQQLIKLSAYNIFVLNNYLRDTYGDHVEKKCEMHVF